jgi:sugar transferase (PEP-CTERM/EpsH1 system associated)
VAPVKQLRVLHVVNRLDLGGTESGILKVISGLGTEEFVHAICTARGHRLEIAKEWGLEGKLYDAGTSGSNFQFLVSRFARIMARFKPDIVHSRNWGAIEAVFAGRLARVPVVIHSEHGYELEMLRGEPLRRRLFRRAAYAAADAVFTVTADLREYHARQAWMDASRIRVLANGVDTKRFENGETNVHGARANLGLPPKVVMIGSVGRLVAIKGHLTLLQAVEILVREGLDLSVALAGDGPEMPNLRDFTANSPFLNGRVYFLGASRDIPSVLRALDIFVLPSISEGMSNTLLEAMSAGLPVIASRVGGNLELVQDSITGLLFSAGDALQLSEKISSLVKSAAARRTLGASARARMLSMYRLEDMILRYRDLYSELAAKRGVLAARAA